MDLVLCLWSSTVNSGKNSKHKIRTYGDHLLGKNEGIGKENPKVGKVEGAKPLQKSSSPSPLKERETLGSEVSKYPLFSRLDYF